MARLTYQQSLELGGWVNALSGASFYRPERPPLRPYDCVVTRDEYRSRMRTLRPLLQTFKGGRLEVGGSGGARGMLFLRLPDGQEFFLGGAAPEEAHAIAAAVNFVLDLAERQA